MGHRRAIRGDAAIAPIDVGWQATRALRLSLGAQNVFDIYPDENIASTVSSVAVGSNGADNAGTQPYNAVSPFGFNGRSVFMRGSYSF